MAYKGLHFGAFELNLEVRELRKHGLRVKLPEQPFHALVLLLENPGNVVTREELRRALWPDENWGDLDHRLNKTINRIREALGDSAESPRFLETVPRVGYRFLVPVEPLQTGGAQATSEQPIGPADRALLPVVPPTSGSRVWGWPLITGILVAVALGLALPGAVQVLGKKSNSIPLVSAATPITTYLGSELYPDFSPDGRQVAFSWNGESQTVFHVFVTSVNPGGARQLTKGEKNDLAPVWSPDGRSVAFLREVDGRTAEVRVVQPDGSNERRIATVTPAHTDHPLSWTKDSRWLVIAANPPGDGPPALFLLSVETGELRRLTSPAVQWGGDLSPVVSPDGSKLAFTRSTSTVWRDVFVVPLSRDMMPLREPVRITEAHRRVDTIAWTPDSQALYFSASATLAGARFLSRVSVVPNFVNTGLVETGIEGSQPALSSSGELAYVRKNIEQTSIWQIQPNSSAPARWSRLMSSTRRDFTADISPDGKRLVFSSVRSGPTEIWICNVDGSGLDRITSLGATPRWSPDGRRIAFESTADGQTEIYVIDVATRALLRLTNGPGTDIYPSWSRDGRFIYFSSDRTGEPQIWKVPSGGGAAAQITRHGGTYAVETFDGKEIYYTTPQHPAAIRFVPSSGGQETDVIRDVVGFSSIALAQHGLFYLSSLTSVNANLDFYDIATRSSRRIAAIEHPVHHVLSSPPDGHSVLFTQIDREDSDLMLLKAR